MGREKFSMKSSFNRAARPRGAAFDKIVPILSVAFTLGALLSVVLVYTFVRNLAAGWTGTGLPSFQLSGGDDNGTAVLGATPTAVLLDELPDPWSGTERITILLLGLDFRDWESGEGPPRSSRC